MLEEHYGPEPLELVAQAEEKSKHQDREFRRGRHRTCAEFPSFRREGPLILAAMEAGSLMAPNAVGGAWQLGTWFSRFCRQCSPDDHLFPVPSVEDGFCLPWHHPPRRLLWSSDMNGVTRVGASQLRWTCALCLARHSTRCVCDGCLAL